MHVQGLARVSQRAPYSAGDPYRYESESSKYLNMKYTIIIIIFQMVKMFIFTSLTRKYIYTL